MFGYVKTFTPELKVCEHEYYKAVYCGLCKTLGKRYGFISRMTLSYDFAFLAMLHADVSGEVLESQKCRCIVHPCKNKNCVSQSTALDFSAACAMIMLYYKVLDNIRDSGFIKKLIWYLALPFVRSTHKKAARAYPKLNEIISKEMSRQAEIESRAEVFIDEAADPSACTMQKICEEMATNNDERQKLGRFGYLLGRWVYLIDACDDLERDQKSGSFNAFKNHEEAIKSCNFTAAELQNAYAQLKLGRFAPIISNIVFLGLKDTLSRIQRKAGHDND